MVRTRFKRAFSIFLTAMLALQLVMPYAAYAQQREVEVDNHTTEDAQATPISGIRIDDVDAPKPGIGLDDKAVVSTTENHTWEIPVLWVRDDLQVDRDDADEGRTYLPVLAFFVPQGYALDAESFTVTLSDSLTELFGSEETISVYDASTGITYILPASLKDLFVQARANAQTAADAEQANGSAAGDAAPCNVAPGDSAPDDAAQTDEPVTYNDMDGEESVDVFCAQTARDALTDEDLEWLIELIISRLQPQAVELLLNSFPTFGEAAKKGEIGQEIGLYIYYQKGDDDGDPSHQTLSNALAYVVGDAKEIDGEIKYCYLLAVDVKSLLKRDEEGNPIRDETTGKYILLREGNPMVNFENTIVHETMHAIMDDFNRTGMVGGINLEDVITDSNGQFKTQALFNRYLTYKYPRWFIEGIASAVENVYQFRYWAFQILRRGEGAKGHGTGDLNSSFTAQDVLTNYLFAKYSDGSDVFFDINYSDLLTDENGNKVDSSASKYVTGYLATLYLCELAARNSYGESTIQTDGDSTTINTTMLRGGFNAIASQMHKGSSLDEVIRIIAPIDGNGQALYTSTNDFANKFIKGPLVDDTYYADRESMTFVLTFLNYMLALDESLGDGRAPDGSILVPFEQYYNTVLDSDKEVYTDYLHIINSNTMVESTVKGDTAKIGGGKSSSDNGVTAASPQRTEELPVAAKAKTKAKAAKASKAEGVKTEATETDTKDEAATETTDAQTAGAQTAEDETHDETNEMTTETEATGVAEEPTAEEPAATEEPAAAEEPVAEEQVTATEAVAEEQVIATEPEPAPELEGEAAPAPEAEAEALAQVAEEPIAE